MTLSESPDAPDFSLEEIPLLQFMPPDVRTLVTASFVPVTFPFGSEIVREGDESDSFYVLLSGRARVLKNGEGAEEVHLNTLGPGDSFGEAALLEHGRRTATVRTSTEVRALRLDGAVFRALVATNPAIRDAVELQSSHRALANFFALYSPFARLAPDALALMLRELEAVSVGAGDVVIREGDAPGPLYVVEEGRLRAYRRRDDEIIHLAFYRRGDVFGERSLFTGTPRAATVEAAEASRLLRMSPDTYGRLLSEHPEFRHQIESRVAQYEYDKVAAVPLDFAQELLPAEAEAAKQAAPPTPDRPGLAEQADEVVRGPFTTPDGRFTKSGGRIRSFPHVWQLDEADCGAACVAMVCRHFGRAVSINRIRQEVGTGIEGTSLRGIAGGAEQLGLATRAVKASRRNLDQMPLPAVLHWGGNHWVVLYDVGPKHVRIADPAIGLRRLPREDSDEKWTGYAALFEPTEAFGQAPEGETGAKWLWQFFRPHRRQILTASLLALAVSALQMVLPVFIQIVIDRVLPARDLDLLRTLALSLLALIFFMSLGSLVQRYLLARAAVGIDGTALDFLTGKLLALPMRYFYSRRIGDIMRRLGGVRLVREFAVQNGVMAMTWIAQLVAAVVIMFVYSPVLTLVYLALAPFYALMMRVAVKRLRPIFDNLEESFGRYSSRQIDAIKGMEAVKAMGAEKQLQAQMLDEFQALSSRLFRADFTSMCYDGGVQLLSFISLALFIWVGALQVLDGQLSVGGLVTFNALVGLANPSLVGLLSLFDQLQYNSIMLNRLNDVFEEEPEQGDDHSHLLPVPSVEGRVTLDGVGFRYGGAESPVILEGVSVDVAPGTLVAVVGRSGSGKTTLAKCLAGLLEPTQGRILYDGTDMTTLDYRSLRRHIGFVLQENFLFSDTIARNIAFGDPEPDPERVVWAAHVANAHDFVERLPFGYETLVGETGMLLSGGQRQRIAIARAVYNRPPVLILDEATSSLDAESERGVKDSMDRLLRGRTSFVIAHRLSTIRDADLILVLERGRLVEQGNHDELMARRGLYFYLSSQQLVG